MKKNILIMCFLCVLNIKAQSITELMVNFDNKFALEHTELILKKDTVKRTEPIGSIQELIPYINHQRIGIIDIDNNWLQKITDLVKPNPSILFSYLETDNYNLSAYILLSHIFMIDLPTDDTGEDLYISMLKSDISSIKQGVDPYLDAENIPLGVDKTKYIINTIWKDIAPQANARIKALLP